MENSLEKIGKLVHDASLNMFTLPIEDGSGGTETATLMYRKQKDFWDLIYLVVPTQLQGKGIGGAMAGQVLDYLAEKNIKAKLTCGFLKLFYHKNPKYKDIVVDKDH